MRELSFVSRERKPVMTLEAPACLLSGSGVENRSQTPLEQVAEPGFPARPRAYLLQSGSDPDPSGQHGWPPLAWAARGGHLEAIRTSVRHLADLDRPGDGQYGWTPRSRAFHKGQLPVVCAYAGAPPPAYRSAI
jgi:ankyrin repeat protein